MSVTPYDLVVVGQGAAGAPTGGVVSIQGVAGGTALPISGTFSATPPVDVTPGTVNVTAQDVASASAAQANGQAFITGAPTANSAASFALASVEGIRVQVNGTWTGTLALEVSIDGGTTWVASGAHQNGTAMSAASFTGNFIGVLNVAGCTNVRVRATAAWTGTATVKVIETSNPGAVYVGNAIKVTDGTNTQPTGDAVARSLAVQVNDGTNVVGTAAHPVQVNVTDGTHSQPTGDAAARSVFVELTDGTNVLGTVAHPVVTGPLLAATATSTNVASSASNVNLLALNTARKGATIYNDSTQILYLKLGTTASTTSYTVQLAPAGGTNSYYEIPFGYTGNIDGIWASANGNARIVELT